MSSRDFMKRFRGGGGGGSRSSSRSASMSSTNTSGSNNGSISNGTGNEHGDKNNSGHGVWKEGPATPAMTPPRVVTPTKGVNAADGGEAPSSPLLHGPTATSGGGLTHAASPLKLKDTSMRYSLNTSKSSKSATESMIPNSPSSPVKSYNNKRLSSEKLKVAHSMALQKTDSESDGRMLSPTSKIVKQDPNAYKIFLLLLQPQSKIFELIQLIYSPYDTTIGNILELIPENATEQALGTQEYIGLCRPKTQQELLDKEQLASEARPGMEGTANITLGEILVAIPQGFTGSDVASLSKQILANPKIVKLLKRADPLAPKNKRRRNSSSSRRHSNNHRSSSSKIRVAEQVHVLEKHDEHEEEQPSAQQTQGQSQPPSRSTSASTNSSNVPDKRDAEHLMKMAMDHAAAEAAAANAAIPGGATKSKSILIHRSGSISGMSETQSMEDFSAQESLDDSFSSWSKSFDASFSAQSSIASGASKRALRRKDRQARRMRILQRSAVAAFGLMIVFYIMDPSKDQQQLQQLYETTSQTPMGFMGILQCLFLLLTLYKVERLIRTTRAAQQYSDKNNNNGKTLTPAVYMSEERRCPFLKAAGRAMKRFKQKYGKRLKKSLVASGTLEQQQQQHHHQQQHEPKSESHKLRSFSLKAANNYQGLDQNPANGRSM